MLSSVVATACCSSPVIEAANFIRSKTNAALYGGCGKGGKKKTKKERRKNSTQEFTVATNESRVGATATLVQVKTYHSAAVRGKKDFLSLWKGRS